MFETSKFLQIFILFVAEIITNFNYGTTISDSTDFEKLLHVETISISRMNKFIESSGCVNSKLRRNIDRYNETVTFGLLYGADNPVHYYLLLKNIFAKWQFIETEFVKYCRAIQMIYSIKALRNKNLVAVPTAEHMRSAITALVGLHLTYNLTTEAVATGAIEESRSFGIQFHAEDCVEMAKALMNENEFSIADTWLEMASEKLSGQTQMSSSVDKEEIQNLQKRYNHLKLDINEDFGRTQNSHEESRVYESLCRGENVNELNSSVSQLFCYYKKDTPFLFLAPLKVEILNANPKILRFHYVLSYPEITVIQNLATPELQRAKTGGSHITDSRTARMAYIDDDDHEIFTALNKRMEQMTNLDINSSELLQVVRYETGGHHYLHYDAFQDPWNDRIATVLFHGDAVFWFNLLKNGELDSSTLHAGCPILHGKKWIANKWIHNRGQEFRRPCSLHKSE